MGWFFGYGSLVNQHTHTNRPVHRATLSDWEREWCATRLRPMAFLSARPAPGKAIDGLVAPVPNGDWAALDEREFAYERLPVRPMLHGLAEARPAEVYSVASQHRDEDNPGEILLSYVDVIAEGYLEHFGEAGVLRFFATTRGWRQMPVLDDRAGPAYPRHRDVGDKVRALVDAQLGEVGARLKAPD